MKKNKIDAFSNMSSFFKYETNPQVCFILTLFNIKDEQIIHLRLDAPDKIVMNFSCEPNELLMKEIDHILKDDDSDLLYFDKELNIFDNNLSESAIKMNRSLSTKSSVSSTSDNNSKNPEFVKPVIGGATSTKDTQAKPKRIPSAKPKK